MALQVGELYALLKLDDAQFKKALEDAERRMSDLAKKSSAAFAAIAGSITAAAIAGGRYADQMQAIAGQTGLAVESVQALSHAAMRFNADLGLLQTSLRAFVRRSAEAAQGNMSFLQTFQMLGISQDEVAAGLHDIEGLFLLVAERISRLPTEAQRSAAAMQLLGDAGRQLVPMLSQGASGIREAMEEARRLGIVTRTDAVAGLADLVSELDVLRAQLGGVSRMLAAEFVPTMRAAISLLSQGAATVANMDESTRRLVGTIGIGTVGFVGSMAALTTATWGAVRAWQALSVTLRLASGPAGWIALAASAVISLATGLGLASFHARQARMEVQQFSNLADLDRELERVNRELAEAEARLKELQELWTTPVRGGPQITFRAADPDEEPLLERVQRLREYRDALLQQRDELQRLQAQQKEWLDTLTSSLEVAEETESEVYRRWLEDIEKINQAHDVTLEKIIAYRQNSVAAKDLAEWIRMVEWERVAALEEGLRTQEAIIEATSRALADERLLASEAQELEYALAMAEARASRLRAELVEARDALFLSEYATRFEEFDHLFQLLTLHFETGRTSAEQLAERVGQILEQLRELDDGTVSYLSRLRQWEALYQRILAAIPTREAVAPPTPPLPEVLPAEERLRRQFERIRLLVEADLMPVEDAVAQLTALRAELIRMATQTGSLASATDEQIQLYIQLTSAIEAWIESLKEAPSRLEEIRAAMERALGVGMAVEREIARATGVGFDPITYEMAVLERAIREMYEATGEITAEMERLLYQLAALSHEAEALALTQAVVTSALDAFGRNLGDIGRVLARSIRFEAGRGLAGFSLDPTAFLTGAVATGIDMLFRAIGGLDSSSAALERAAQALQQASESWRRTLSEAQFHELISATPAEAISELQRVRSEVWAEMRRIERWGIWPWERGTYDALKQQLREIDQAIAELGQGWASDLEARIKELLGITTRSLQNAVASAFSAATIDDFTANIENALRARVRNALVTAFLESTVMAPLFEELGDQIREMAEAQENLRKLGNRDFRLFGVSLRTLFENRVDEASAAIQDIIAEIKERSQGFYELLDEMGLLAETTEQVNRQFERLVNVPLGFRTLQALRFESMTPQAVPTFHTGGVMPYDGLANLHRGEIILTPEQARALGGDGGDVHLHFHGPVYGLDDFNRRVEDAARALQRRESLRRTGNPTGWGGRR